ncbi:Detected protein of confused Function [Hibiscus syriacus]|uniref:Detected protein of confused Function n=1 Tax=Hibiscus syriacus TaxID=106335 RepID=A0A6A2Z4I9_HIBSY|nr:Detected protein of confused Function [Hibiscus syriacus]
MVEEEENLHYWGNISEEEYYKQQGIKGSKSFYTSPRGLSLFTRSWLPLSQNPPRGIIFGIHGIHGGAIALLAHFADPKGLQGAVLVAPMVKISGKVRPRRPIPQALTFISNFLPTLAIVPTEDLLHKSIKVEEKKIVGNSNPFRYRGKPRLGTVVELLRVTDLLSQKLSHVSIPFLVVHGSADVVTDPEVSRTLYEEASSRDKTLKIYEGMWHSLLFGEPDENIDVVRSDVLSWWNDRCNTKI